jgi:hypothetical protein
MAFYLDPSARPDPSREERERATPGRIELRPAQRVAVLGKRSLACPACEMPLAISATLSWSEPVACPFCDEVAPTRSFIRAHGWPEVRLVARLD